MENVWVNKAERCARFPAVRPGYLCGRVRGLPLRCDLKPTHPLGGAGISGTALIVCVTHLEGFFPGVTVFAKPIISSRIIIW